MLMSQSARAGLAWAVLLASTSCSDHALPPRTQPSVALNPDELVTVTQHSLQTGPHIAGTLTARDRATITTQVSGAVRQVYAELGDTVRRGELLARIDPAGRDDAVRSAQASVTSAQQALALAKRQVARSESLVRSGALARHQLEVDRNAAALAQAQLRQAQAQLASAQHGLAETRVRSPMDGVVSVQAVYEGDVVNAGSELFVIIDPSSLRLEASLASSALPQLKVGTPVEFHLHDHAADSFHGEITRIAPAADPTTNQIAILASVPNADGRALAGLFAEGRVITETKTALAVPLSAIDWTGAAPNVAVIRAGHAQHVEIEIGETDDVQELVEVRSGLHRGDRVVVGPARVISTGTTVTVRGSPRSSPAPAADGDTTADATHQDAWHASQERTHRD
jgi:RND family efflux transporter MFP subunit